MQAECLKWHGVPPILKCKKKVSSAPKMFQQSHCKDTPCGELAAVLACDTVCTKVPLAQDTRRDHLRRKEFKQEKRNTHSRHSSCQQRCRFSAHQSSFSHLVSHVHIKMRNTKRLPCTHVTSTFIMLAVQQHLMKKTRDVPAQSYESTDLPRDTR